MILTEEHIIRCGNRKNRELYKKLDAYCFASKNLHNYANYLIVQCGRISDKLAKGEELLEWETSLLREINSAIGSYNTGRPTDKCIRTIDSHNGFIANAYFLSWYLKTSEPYKEMPYATCAQICLQELCREWKSFYKGLSAFRSGKEHMTGRPRRPGYLEKRKGRNALVLTSQNAKADENGSVRLPAFLSGIHIRTEHRNIRQIRFLTGDQKIRIQIMYEEAEQIQEKAEGTMGIDLGVNNLMAIAMDTAADPVLLSGRPVKSVNQYYNKEKARLQAAAKKSNGLDTTKRIHRLTEKRNRKIRDYMHKASRKVIEIAIANGIGTIVIGTNKGWKQESDLSRKGNQSFVGIPFHMLTDMIAYKGKLSRIEVIVSEEMYTSGTSFLDGEAPVKENYNKSRRVKRGLFRSNKGVLINADVNAAYQIMKKAGKDLKADRTVRKVIVIKAA